MRESEGFREYVTARRGALGRAAYLMSGDRYLAEDLVQTSLTRAWTRWDTVSRAGNVDAYVHRMLVNAVRSAARRRWRGELPAGDGLPDRGRHDPYHGFEDRDTLLAAVRRLPPRQRAVIALRYYLDRTEVDTAAVLGCSVGTVKSQNAKAIARLRAYLVAPD